MHTAQVEAERKKRAAILESEGIRCLTIWLFRPTRIFKLLLRSAEINVAEGRKQSAILKSEAEKAQLINEAEGQVNPTI